MAQAAPMMLIGGGTALQAGAGYIGGEAEADWLKYSAALAKREKQLTLRETRQEMRRFGKQAEKFKGEQRADIAAMGTKLEGAPLDLLAEAAAELEADKLAIGYRGRRRATTYETEAREAKTRAKYVRQTGRLGSMATLLSTGGRLGLYGYI